MNAYEQLRRTDDLPAARPDPRFAAHLRTQVEAALAPTIELPEREAYVMTDTIASNTATSNTAASGTGTSDTSTAPANAQVLVPYLAVADAPPRSTGTPPRSMAPRRFATSATTVGSATPR